MKARGFPRWAIIAFFAFFCEVRFEGGPKRSRPLHLSPPEISAWDRIRSLTLGIPVGFANLRRTFENLPRGCVPTQDPAADLFHNFSVTFGERGYLWNSYASCFLVAFQHRFNSLTSTLRSSLQALGKTPGDNFTATARLTSPADSAADFRLVSSETPEKTGAPEVDYVDGNGGPVRNAYGRKFELTRRLPETETQEEEYRFCYRFVHGTNRVLGISDANECEANRNPAVNYYIAFSFDQMERERTLNIIQYYSEAGDPWSAGARTSVSALNITVDPTSFEVNATGYILNSANALWFAAKGRDDGVMKVGVECCNLTAEVLATTSVPTIGDANIDCWNNGADTPATVDMSLCANIGDLPAMPYTLRSLKFPRHPSEWSAFTHNPKPVLIDNFPAPP